MENKSHSILIETANNHIQLAKQELSECSNTIYKNLENLHEEINDKELQKNILDALTSLQLVDIITQRLDKLEIFLKKMKEDTIITDKELEEFAWENEVNQNEIDNFFNKG